jgi:DNA-binding transcriptional LysR family regulator
MLKELSTAPFISWGENSNMHKILISACEKAGFYPNIVAISNDRECYERFLRAGVGIGLGREDIENDMPDITYLDLCDFDESYAVFCYYKNEGCYGSIKSFVDFLKTKIR